MIEKIVSGGQSGVDRAALDAAMGCGLPHGGWCPLGRRAEDGILDDRYDLSETPTGDYTQRTDWNVRDSDATLILSRGRLEGGTALTRQYTRRHDKPCWVVDLNDTPDPAEIAGWLADHDIRVLNVAGPRESKQPGIYAEARAFLLSLLVPISSEQ